MQTKQLKRYFEKLGIKCAHNEPTKEEIKKYKEFCKANGFKASTEKTGSELEKEVLHFKRQIAITKFEKVKEISKHPRRIIQKIFRREITSPKGLSCGGRYLVSIFDFIDKNKFDKYQLRKIESLILKIFDRTNLLQEEEYVPAILSFANFIHFWNDPSSWKPKTHNSHKQFSALARHLFAKYDVPEFMDNAWFDKDNKREQKWFLHIGQGNNIRTAENLPLKLTKKEAHYFSTAPKDYSINEAFMWARVTTLGGTQREIDALRPIFNINDINNDFWLSVIRFFIANPMLDTQQYGPIVDYIKNQKFEQQRVFVDRGVFEWREPPQPGFTIKGRTVDTLLIQVENWHKKLNKENKFKDDNWPSCKINGFYREYGEDYNKRIWRIYELLSVTELRAEGREMHHCVGSYGPSCAKGWSAIYSMTYENNGNPKKMLTIEVRLKEKKIVQARGKNNAMADDRQKFILNQWAKQEGLAVPNYV